ncbi:hypothetical protein XAP6164_1690013 [Xanthomonas phaseoli pv. phaseoli]|nr:hypothetical protein XAP6164_1690013 [Xanthomonas phaseoli pv. phaseoli]
MQDRPPLGGGKGKAEKAKVDEAENGKEDRKQVRRDTIGRASAKLWERALRTGLRRQDAAGLPSPARGRRWRVAPDEGAFRGCSAT